MQMQKKKPAVSVVIPVYNVEDYLRECVDSVLTQTMQDFEIILVDDGATDSSGAICDQYGALDTRVRVIHRENGGLSEARNTGLDAATGEYVYFLDSDDYIEQCTLEHLLNLAEKEQADVVFFDAYVFFTGCEPDPNVYQYHRRKAYGSQNGRQMLLELLASDEYRTAVPLMFLCREYMTAHALRFRSGILHEDELFTFYVYDADGRVAHCHEELYARRIRQASIMTGASRRRRYDSVYAIYFELSDLYRKKETYGEAARQYLARMSRSVLAKYRMLSEEDRQACAERQRMFARDVIANGGYRDWKLKIKCSTGIRKLCYRIGYKFERICGKSS